VVTAPSMKDRMRTAKQFDRFHGCPDRIGFLAATKPRCDASTKFATAGAIRSAALSAGQVSSELRAPAPH
jgi:hypothetical protein